jgi:hypothetical protein
MHLDQIVPIGRSAADYRAMFALEGRDRGRRLRGCGDGPAAFDADWTREDGQVVSLDPIHIWPPGVIQKRIADSFPDIVQRMHAEPGRFALKPGNTIDALASGRWQAMQRFLADYASDGRKTA